MQATPEDILFVSVLTTAEIRRGIELLPPGKRRKQLEEWQDELQLSFAARLLPITKGISDRWAVLAAEAQHRGAPLAIMDGLIAATALEHNLTLATRNVRDFAQLHVRVLNPWEI